MALTERLSALFLLQKTIASYTVDGTFFPKTPKELLREKQFHSVPFLLGVNNHEFGWLIPRVSVPFTALPQTLVSHPSIITTACELSTSV